MRATMEGTSVAVNPPSPQPMTAPFEKVIAFEGHTLFILQLLCHNRFRRVSLSKSRSKKVVRRPGRPQILGPALVQTPPALLPSLPPATTGLTVEPSPIVLQRNKCPRCGTLNAPDRPSCAICDLDLKEIRAAGRPTWWLPPDSKVRRC